MQQRNLTWCARRGGSDKSREASNLTPRPWKSIHFFPTRLCEIYKSDECSRRQSRAHLGVVWNCVDLVTSKGRGRCCAHRQRFTLQAWESCIQLKSDPRVRTWQRRSPPVSISSATHTKLRPTFHLPAFADYAAVKTASVRVERGSLVKTN